MKYCDICDICVPTMMPLQAACRRLWHSPLLVLFVAIALHLQGCDDEVRDPLLRVMMFSAIEDTMHIFVLT